MAPNPHCIIENLVYIPDTLGSIPAVIKIELFVLGNWRIGVNFPNIHLNDLHMHRAIPVLYIF